MFYKVLLGKLSICQTVRSNGFVGPYRSVSEGCKGYQQTILEGRVLNVAFYLFIYSIFIYIHYLMRVKHI